MAHIFVNLNFQGRSPNPPKLINLNFPEGSLNQNKDTRLCIYFLHTARIGVSICDAFAQIRC